MFWPQYPHDLIPPQSPNLWHEQVSPNYGPGIRSPEEINQIFRQGLIQMYTPAPIQPQIYIPFQPLPDRVDPAYAPGAIGDYITDNKNINDYQLAFNQINAMLKGKAKRSVIDAYYSVEQAYGSVYMSYDEYKSIYKKSAAFIRSYLKQQHVPLLASNLHIAIQHFMSDTLSIRWVDPDTKKVKRSTHYPFHYDYGDYAGEQDYRNYFSTKCLATGTGQCNSMPIVYLCLAQELGIKAYLSFAPLHSFIKWQTYDGDIVGYEPTTNWSLPDKWYQADMNISYQAIRSGLYLDTLNQEQIIANCLVDLAINYLHENLAPDTAFVQQCLNSAASYFPKHNNLFIYLVRGKVLTAELRARMWQQGIETIDDPALDPESKALYQRLLQNDKALREMGYETMPDGFYEQVRQDQDSHPIDPNAKVPKSLFQTD